MNTIWIECAVKGRGGCYIRPKIGFDSVNVFWRHFLKQWSTASPVGPEAAP